MSLSEWDAANLQQNTQSLLKPPSVVGSIKALNNLLLPEPFPRKKGESVSLRNASIDMEPKASISKIDRKDSRDSRSASIDINESGSKSSAATSAKGKTNLKKRSSTKQKSEKARSSEILNNGRMDSVASIDATQKPTKRIQNNTKNTNKISPHGKNSFDANDLQLYNNSSNYYPYVDQQQKQQQPPQQQHPMLIHHRGSVTRRRMSTMDSQTFTKIAQMELEHLQSLRAQAIARRDSKVVDEKPTKPLSPEPTVSIIREPIKFTARELQKRFEQFTEGRETYSLYLFPENNKFRYACDWFVTQKWFDNVILLFIALNCITLAMERPNIPPNCAERYFLSTANYVFTFVFTLEMFVKVSE